MMKKAFFLSKGLDKFSKQQLKDLESVTGGLAAVPDGVIYFPTSGGRRCADGQVWSESLQRCVVVGVIAHPLRK